MKTIQVRNVPDSVHQRLQSRAEAAGQSMQEYLLELVTHATGRMTMQEAKARAKEIRAMAPIDVTREQVVADIHAEREERDRRWDR